MSIKVENFEVVGWEHAIRGMRNPLNSWARSDTSFYCYPRVNDNFPHLIGANDLDLMKRLARGGSDDRKYLRMITVYADITAPLYWWKEWDTYKVGTVRNSCSTMHKIQAKEFTLDDFSHEHLESHYLNALEMVIQELNDARKYFNNWEKDLANDLVPEGVYRKDYWWQMIQLLPSSYNQKATVMLNYEVLTNMYHARKFHKLDEWRKFCEWVESLPYSELITGEE